MFVGERHFILEADMIGQPDDLPTVKLIGYSCDYNPEFSGVLKFY